MKRSSHHRPAFTLLELVVVLAILAVVTTLAIRSLDGLEDESRYDKTTRGLEELSAAVLGSPDDRAADGTRTVSGFVADMGRLPVTTGAVDLTLGELWENPGVPFDVRPAVVANGVSLAMEDPQVLVAGGWRGPYLRLPIGAITWLDGWGNPMSSPATASPPNPYSTGYARLRDAANNPIITAGQEIRIVRHLGANGRLDAADTGYDREGGVDFTNLTGASLSGQIEVLDGESPATADSGDTVTVRIFSPNPADSSKISVASAVIPFATNPVTWSIPGATVGPRVVRAYFDDANASGTTLFRKSPVTQVTLRPGVNSVNLTIDR